MALAVTSAIWQQINSPALDIRRFISADIQEGVVAATDLAVAQRGAGANMSVDIAAGQATVQGDTVTNQGLYYAYNDATFNLATFTAANATNPRIDRVTLRVRDAFHGDAANDLSFQVVTGTATAGATLANLTGAAAVPASSLLLANVLVPANATTITTANIDTTVRTRVTSAAPGMVLIQDQLLAAIATSVVFSAIPATYKHLLVEWDALTDNVADQSVTIQFNADTTANYDYQYLLGSAATASAANNAAQTTAYAGAAASSSSGTARSSGSIQIQNYANATSRKSYTAQSGTQGGTARVYNIFGQWRGTAAITSVTLLIAAGNFPVGSRFTLYGLT